MKRLIGYLLLLTSIPLLAQEKMIADNSFLIEEAFNQEAGVVQHIFTGFLSGHSSDPGSTFTQEWPVLSQSHQLSLTLDGDRSSGTFGVNSVLLNYRYQVPVFEKNGVFFSPRLSLMVPVRSEYEKIGLQYNLPLSSQISDHFIMHYNIGGSYTFLENSSISGIQERFVGFSAIWMPVYSTNFLLEALAVTAESLEDPETVQTERTVTINPGVRFAVDIGSLQIVPGISFPFLLGKNPPRLDGVFLYLSFEHPF